MTLINERIRYGQVRVIDDQNNQLGILDTREALNIARERELDLILVAEKAQPPVCRIMNYGKFKYEKSKRDKGNKKVTANELKMVRLHPRTGVHDRQILERHAEKFLRSGHKVRVVCQFRGRENAHPQIGRAQLDAVAAALEEVATVEGTINKQGRDMTMFMVPKPGVKPIPKIAKDTRKNQSNVLPEIEEIDDELDVYSAPGVEDDDDDHDDAHDDVEGDEVEGDEVESDSEDMDLEDDDADDAQADVTEDATEEVTKEDATEIVNNVEEDKGELA